MKAFAGSVLGLLLGVAFAWWWLPAGRDVGENAYERVLRTGTLRCAYGLWEPAVMRDPNTGEFSGLIYDFMQELGKALNIKVEYSLEVPWDSIHVALASGKADAHCAGVFATSARGRNLAFSSPLFFSPTVAFARWDDHRFDNNLSAINDSGITVAISDDDITTEIYQQDFPLARTYELPQMAPPEELFLVVAQKKADVTLNGPSRLKTFERGNPRQVRVIPTEKPLRIFANTLAVDMKEQELVTMLDTAVNQLIDNGTMARLVEKYRKKGLDTAFLVPVERPYVWTTKGGKQ